MVWVEGERGLIVSHNEVLPSARWTFQPVTPTHSA